MLLRSFGTFEDSTVFAILLVNAIAPVFDRKLPLTKKEKQIIYQKQLDDEQAKKQAEIEKENEQKNAEIQQMVEKVKANIEKQQLENNEIAEPEDVTEEIDEEDDDVPTLQHLSDTTVTDNNENGGDENV